MYECEVCGLLRDGKSPYSNSGRIGHDCIGALKAQVERLRAAQLRPPPDTSLLCGVEGCWRAIVWRYWKADSEEGIDVAVSELMPTPDGAAKAAEPKE